MFQESKGSPLTEIHCLKVENLLSITLTIREYLLRKIVDILILREAIVEAISECAMFLQKNKARASSKRVSEGR